MLSISVLLGLLLCKLGFHKFTPDDIKVSNRGYFIGIRSYCTRCFLINPKSFKEHY